MSGIVRHLTPAHSKFGEMFPSHARTAFAALCNGMSVMMATSAKVKWPISRTQRGAFQAAIKRAINRMVMTVMVKIPPSWNKVNIARNLG